jgi:hypothetical protein
MTLWMPNDAKYARDYGKNTVGKDNMQFGSRSFLHFVLMATLAASSVAQKPASNTEATDDTKGFTEVETFQGTVNSQSGVMKLDSNLGYNFNKHFGLFGGVPVYFAHVSSITTTTGTTTTTTPASTETGLGNVYMGLLFQAPNPALDYASTITAGAPTGSKTKGLSTGRASIDWDNRFEHSFSHLTPFFEGGLANTVPDSRFFTRSFTSVGAISHLEEGADLELFRHVSVGASAYQIVPFGNQKVISRLAKQGSSGTTGTGKKPPFDTPGVISGTSDLTREHGFNTWVAFEPSKFWRLEAGYTRSATFDLNSFAFNLRFNVGKMFRSRKSS